MTPPLCGYSLRVVWTVERVGLEPALPICVLVGEGKQDRIAGDGDVDTYR